VLKIDSKIVKKRLLTMHYESGVGHIGGNLSALDFMLVLFHEFIETKDKFVLSKGHSAGALYATLWSLGLLSDEDLWSFHRDDTSLPGHPPAKGIAGIDFATGSLGHGLSLAAGAALSGRLTKSSRKVYCLTSDGEWQEGSMWEALIFAIHQKLGNLTIVIDQNKFQGFGKTEEVSSISDFRKIFLGFGIDAEVVNGHNYSEIMGGLREPLTEIPKILILDTIKGKGVSFLENKLESHYLPLNASQYEQALIEIDAE
jgi:transketolase